ncbi:hypothetical protein EMIHUDRAFT_209266 [Emiliania huxleyi CCMP1516]|uniref:Uncharacterized protein n=2 Tax=Emiliania huxleyi TaxID=2903 RepID=A0A0D3J7Y7_EMIH1|nr:hypothetical protein EMIHUDRAFT_209266 [Emiliania huxleyi CCMP1516]EOD19622.1 hypothetical protein EMIHUDRAFT_209266 [Emiliania huxleyi CCMP1516]|eukprot:XP_005772051.1 hypothetical protein EMIHUDRAFT_209266 [Emiliania huxleyi CCMP1516]
MAPKSRKPPEKTASLFARGGPDSSDDDEAPAKNTGKPSADLRKHFAPKAAAPAAADPTDEVSTDSDDSDDGKFNFDLPAKAGSKAGGNSGRVYKVYYGPNGEYAESLRGTILYCRLCFETLVSLLILRAAAAEEGGNGEAGGGGGDTDLLTQLLTSKRQPEEERRAEAESIAEDVELMMDNGVRVNPALRDMFAGGGSAAKRRQQQQQRRRPASDESADDSD